MEYRDDIEERNRLSGDILKQKENIGRLKIVSSYRNYHCS